MKSFAIFIASALLLANGLIGSTHSSEAARQNAASTSLRALVYDRAPSVSALRLGWGHIVALQTGSGTATPTATPTETAVPSPTPTTTTTGTPSPYPDPVSLLTDSINIYGALKSSHFELVIDGEQKNVEKLHIDAAGNATCTGPSMQGTASASDTLEGTSQSRKLAENFIQVKSHTWIKAKSTKQVWKLQKSSQLAVFGFPIDNPLICPNTSGGGAGSGSGTTDQLKDLVNLGPTTFNGVKVWHIRATDVAVNAQGQTQQETLDFLIGQAHPLPYVFTVTVNDTQNNVTLVQKQILTKFGTKVSVKAPKAGSSKP